MSQKSPTAVFVVQIRRMTSRRYFRGSSYPDLETNGNDEPFLESRFVSSWAKFVCRAATDNINNIWDLLPRYTGLVHEVS